MMIDVGAYIHIPFCHSKCNYCDFYSFKADYDTRQKYIHALINQIKQTSGMYNINTVYIGGGTPSLLTSEQIIKLSDAIHAAGFVAGGEFTVEVNPESVTNEFVDALIKSGVNRVSIGVQSFVDKELNALGRLANSKMCINAYNMIRDHGIDNISIDLMLAIPYQTIDSLKYSLEKTLSLRPEHISAYLLKIEPNTIFGKNKIKEKNDELQTHMYMLVSDTLIKNGYEHYEISNYALPSKRSLHNSSYWKSCPYVAFGCGAHGFDGKKRYYYPKDVTSYIEHDGIIKPITEQILDDKSIINEKIMLGLRTSDGINRNLLNEDKILFMNKLVKFGLARTTDKGYSLTPRGFLVSDSIIVELL